MISSKLSLREGTVLKCYLYRYMRTCRNSYMYMKVHSHGFAPRLSLINQIWLLFFLINSIHIRSDRQLILDLVACISLFFVILTKFLISICILVGWSGMRSYGKEYIIASLIQFNMGRSGHIGEWDSFTQ